MARKHHRFRRFDRLLGLSDSNMEERITRLVVGLLIPCLVTLYGVSCVASREALFLGRYRLVTYDGLPAVAIGVAWIAAGLLCHVWNCWREHERLAGVCEPVSIALALVMGAALAATFLAVLI